MFKLNTKKKSLIFLILVLSLFQTKILRRAKIRVQRYCYISYGFFLNLDQLRIRSFRTITCGSIYLKKEGKGLLLVENVTLNIVLNSLFNLKPQKFRGESIVIDKITIIPIRLRPPRPGRNSNSNSYFLFERKVYPIFTSFLEKVFTFRSPCSHFKINDFQYKGNKRSMDIKELDITEKNCEGMLQAEYDKLNVIFPFKIEKNTEEKTLLYSSTRTDTAIKWDHSSILILENFNFLFQIKNNNKFQISGEIENWILSSIFFSNKPSKIENTQFDFVVNFTNELFEIDYQSQININNIPLAFYVRHDLGEQDLVRLSFTFQLEGTSFFQSYPFFSLSDLNTIDASGHKTIKLDYLMSIKDFSKYYFHVHKIEDSLKILDFGKFDISYLSSKFQHEINRNGKNIKKLHLSEADADFTKIEDIPAKLISTIICTEDPNFYHHKGIDSHYIGVAIALNISKQKFVKGASTITMQLARNLFLNSHQNFSRKIEEMIIAWLLENQVRIGKSRILEIYFNIIEFGNNIYGIRSAAKYYFDKELQNLGVTDFIVLSYIIPRPKYFLEAYLMKSPQLKENLRKHIENCSLRMYKEKLITLDDLNEINYDVELKKEFGSFYLL